MSYLIDTNVLSELRRREPNAQVVTWMQARPRQSLYLSVLSLGEIRKGIEEKRLRDPAQAEALDRWMARMLTIFAGHTLPITEAIADRWGALCPGQPLPPADGLIAATALVHDLTLVTRNTGDFDRGGVRALNPWK